jgi:hypothetical protein
VRSLVRGYCFFLGSIRGGYEWSDGMGWEGIKRSFDRLMDKIERGFL